VTFHDGTSFDADAVVFAFSRLIDKAHPNRPEKSAYAPFYVEVIGKVEAKDAKTVVFTLKTPSAVFLQLVAIFPAGIPGPEAVRSTGKKFVRQPVGTGPFRLEEWKTKEKIVLKRNDAYWGKKPALEKLIFIPVNNPQTAIQKLKKGEIEWSSLIDDLKQEKRGKYDEKQCAYCGAEENLSLDHLIPIHRNGPDIPANWVLACRSCNSSKQDKDIFYWYGLERKEEVPSFVLSRYLKLVYDYHDHLRNLDRADLNKDGKLDVMDLAIFKIKNPTHEETPR